MAILDSERSKNLYNSDSYEKNTDNWEDDVSVYRSEAFINAIKNAGLANKIESILDVGCGSGGVLAEIARNRCIMPVNLEGIDISCNAVQLARNLAVKKEVENDVNYSVKSITDIDAVPKKTIISLIHVLEHCPDMLEMLNECSKRSYYQYINIPLEYNLFYAFRMGIPAKLYDKYGHLHFFDESFFLKFLEKNGYNLLAKSYSMDFMVRKSGIPYFVLQRLRKLSLRFFGPLTTIRYMGGISGGYFIEKK